MEIKAGFINDNGLLMPLSFDLRSCPHVLICGRSGSGKGVLLQYMLNSVLQDNALELYIGDPKNSGDFADLTPNYAVYDGCADLIEQAYMAYQTAKMEQTGKRLLLIVDEYPSFILNLEGLDKKRAAAIKNMVSEMLMQGRSLPGGGSCAVWLIAQRADADFFPKGARLNFFVTIAMGRLDPQSKAMLYPGEDIPDYVPCKGRGLILIEGKPLWVFQVPEVPIPRLQQLLRKKAQRRPGG